MKSVSPATLVPAVLRAAICLLIGAGCARPTDTRTASSPRILGQQVSPRRTAASAAVCMRVQQTSMFRKAERLYAKHDKAGALAALARIQPGADWTAAEREYLERQKRIVERREVRGKGPAGVGQPPARGPRSPEQADCGPRALLIVCEKLGVGANLDELRRLAGTTGTGTTMEGLAKAARANGLVAEGVQMNRAALSALDRPAIAWVGGDHYVAVLGVHDGKAEARDPNVASPTSMPVEELLRRSGGVVLRVERGKLKVESGVVR